MENWIKVFEDGIQVRAEIVKGILLENEIHAVVLNKKDTAYQMFGNYQVLVKRDDAIQATKLIQNAITF